MIATCIVHFLVQQSAAAQGEENLSFTTTYTCTHGFDNAIYSSPVALTVVDLDDIKKGAISKNKLLLPFLHATAPCIQHCCMRVRGSNSPSAQARHIFRGFQAFGLEIVLHRLQVD